MNPCYNVITMTEDTLRINAAQHGAITHANGPLLIVAGAGTGKTTTLVEKIKYLIKKDLAKPDEILCLTFTEKAAREMQERIDEAMPYGYARMWISTFHAFADEVLKDDIFHLGLNPAYRLMTPAQSLMFLKKHIFSLNLTYFRPMSSPNKFLEGLLQHFSRLHDEDISPDDYTKWVTMQCHPEVQTKDDMLPEELAQLKELSYAYSAFQNLKLHHDVMDFDDLIYYLLKLFRERTSVLARYQRTFKAVLIDEFQDTNIAQYELIKLLCPAQNNPQLTVVGDDSQAIYKFRGASVSNILNFMADYPQAQQITLRDNYRSSQIILDHAYRLIQHNNPDTLETKLGISKELKSRSDAPTGHVQFEYFKHGDREADWIARKIQTLVQTKGCDLADMAILVRANNHAEPIMHALRQSGIPYQFLGPGTLFRQPEIKEIISYLKVLADLEDSVSLYRVLCMGIFELDMQDVSLLTAFAKKTALPLYQSMEILLSFRHDEWYRDSFEQYRDHLPAIRVETMDRLAELTTMIKDHLAKIHTDSATHILYQFLEESGYLKQLGATDPDRDEKIILNITRFFNKIKSLEQELDDPGVRSAVEYLDMSLEVGDSPLAGDTDATRAHAVHILTVHSAKGLEFPVVFLPHLVKGRFPTTKRREQIPIPESLIKEALPEGDPHILEERRLFYVGMTRAKERLFLTGSEIYGEGVRPHKLSPFIPEAMGAEAIAAHMNIATEKKDQLSIFDFKKHPEDPPIPLPHELKTLSYSQMNTYELCPLKYKYQYLLKIPTPPVAQTSLGSTVHIVLQKFYQEYMHDRTIGISRLQELLETSWIPVGYASRAQAEQTKKEARNLLDNYFHSFHSPDIDIVDLEKSFRIKIDSTVFLTGKIDRVDKKADGSLEIIDYKTGRRPDDKKLKKDMQLAIYAMAAHDPGLYGKPIKKIHLSLYYLQAREKITLQKSEEDVIKVGAYVREIAKEIREGVFHPKIGMWCDSCPFKMLCEAWV